jgi:hypothetical protein
MTKWEYKSFNIKLNYSGFSTMLDNSSFQDTFESLGNDGWELVGMAPESDIDGVKAMLFMFKRPRT